MERKLIREERTKTTIMKVYEEEDGTITEEYYAPMKGVLKRCSKSWWGSTKFWEGREHIKEDPEVMAEFYRSKLGPDYKRLLGMQ